MVFVIWHDAYVHMPTTASSNPCCSSANKRCAVVYVSAMLCVPACKCCVASVFEILDVSCRCLLHWDGESECCAICVQRINGDIVGNVGLCLCCGECRVANVSAPGVL